MPLISTTGKAAIKNARFAQDAYYAAIKGQDLKQASFEQALVLYGTPRRKILPGVSVSDVYSNKTLTSPASDATTHYGLNSTYYTTSTSNLNFAGSVWEGYADDERVEAVKIYVAGSNVIGNGTTLKDAPYSNTGTILSKFYTPSSTQGKLVQYTLNSSGVITGSVEIDDNYYGATPWTVADVIFQQDFESESGYNGNLASFSNLVSSPAIPVTSGIGWLPVRKIVKSTGKAITLRGSETVSISTDISGAWTLEFSMKVDSIEDSLYNLFYTESILSILNAQNLGVFLEAFNRNAEENIYNQNYNNRDIGYRFVSTASSYRSFHVDLSYWRNIAITCSANKIASGTDGTYRQVRIFVDGRELTMSGSTYTDIPSYYPEGFGGGGGGYVAYPGELGFKGNLAGINFGAANTVNFCVDNIRLSKSQKPYANYTPSLPFPRPAGAPSVVTESYTSGVVYQQNFNNIAANTNLSDSWASELGAANIGAAAGWQVIDSPFESGKVAVMKNWVSTNGNILVGPQTNNFTFEISMRVTDYPIGDINYSTGYQSFEYLKIGGLLIYYYRTFCRYGINCGSTANQYFLTLGGKWINLYPKYDATFQSSSSWTHLAVSCRPNNIKVFSNGKLLGQFHSTLSAQAIQLPMAANSSVFASDSVYIDNIRLSNFARYEEEYTPSFPFPSS